MKQAWALSQVILMASWLPMGGSDVRFADESVSLHDSGIAVFLGMTFDYL